MAIKFNGKTLPEWVSVTGISFQTVNVSIMEHEASKRIGNIDAGIKRDGIDIVVSIFISPAKDMTILDQADEIKRFVMGDGWKVSELILLEQPNKFYNARVSNAVDITDAFTHGESEIIFHASDPKKYDVEETVENSSNGEISIDYDGMETTPILIEFTAGASIPNPKFIHEESGKEIRILTTMSSGQKLEIDSRLNKVLINGSNAKQHMAFESNWLELIHGSNTITCVDADGTKRDFKITYRKAD